MLPTKRLRRFSWRANKRSRGPRAGRVADGVVEKARELREQGEPALAVSLLEEQPELAKDAEALVGLALARLAANDLDGALGSLDEAECELTRGRWAIAVNRALVLKESGRFGAAAAEAAKAMDLQPREAEGYLAAISIDEWARSGRGDRKFVASIVERMDRSLPCWREDARVWTDLAVDLDYIGLRRDPKVFEEIFGRALGDATTTTKEN